jgi:NAD-dependent deacetylase sirtuin 4
MRDRAVVVLAGAGCSTESGIPDYRGPEGRLKSRSPVQYDEFVRSAGARTRYWARSTVGWRRVANARPNGAHTALARLEAGNVVRGIITQNVDGLHHAAGSRRVIELHGSLARVRCLSCHASVGRDAFQRRLLDVNRPWLGGDGMRRRSGGAASAPDGDAELADAELEGFEVPHCVQCGGVLKPDVVFFGENVPPDRVEDAWQLFEEGDVLLVVGSSLEVFSGRRFACRATREGVPIAIVNLGPTRVDGLAAAKVEGRVGEVLPVLADELLSP